MHQNLAIILQQLHYAKLNFIVLVPGVCFIRIVGISLERNIKILREFHLFLDNVTRLGDLFQFRRIFQSLWQQLFCPNCPYFWAIFIQLSKYLIILVESFLGNFYRYLATVYWSQWSWVGLGYTILTKLS